MFPAAEQSLAGQLIPRLAKNSVTRYEGCTLRVLRGNRAWCCSGERASVGERLNICRVDFGKSTEGKQDLLNPARKGDDLGNSKPEFRLGSCLMDRT